MTHVPGSDIVTVRELAAEGLSTKAIATRVRDGRLTRLFRGVYLRGPAGPYVRERAALLACGRFSVLSHHSAAALWSLRSAAPATIDVTVTQRHRRAQRGLSLHHAALEADEWTHRHGLRLTTPARTLLDLALVLSAGELERVVHEAHVTRLITPTALRAYVEAHGTRRGIRALRAATDWDPAVLRSELERAMLALIGRSGLPRPRTNARLLGYEVDFLWPEQRLVVETDGYAPHQTRRAFEHDRRKDAHLTAAGYRVLRFTWRQITREPELVAARLGAALVLA